MIENLTRYYEGELTTRQFDKTAGMKFRTARHNHKVKLVFDEEAFKQLIKSDYENMRQPTFMKKHGVVPSVYAQLHEPYEVHLKFLVGWLMRLGLEYDLQITRGRAFNYHDYWTLDVYPEKSAKKITQPKERIVSQELKRHLQLIDEQFILMNEFLQERNIGINTIARIESRLSAMIRFAVSVGIDVERGGLTDEFIIQMAKKEGIV